MSVKRVIFIRPGETDWNRQDRWQGWVACPLNQHGQRQAEALAGFLRNIGPGVLYASDLRRAAQTAEIISQRLGFPPLYDARLRERDIGDWQGLTLEEVQAWYPEEYEHFMHDPDKFRIPGGESLAEVRLRMRAIFDEIVKAGKAETVAVVSHTVTIRALLASLIPNYDARGLRLGNTAVTTIRAEGDGWALVVSNDVAHLEGLDSRAVREL